MRWPAGFRCPRCGESGHYRVVQDGCELFQCHTCRLQASLMAGTMMANTKLPLRVWFLAMSRADTADSLSGDVQVVDAYLGGERSGKTGRGSPIKVPFVAAVALMCTSSASSLKRRRCAPLARRTKCSWYPATLIRSTRHCTEIGHMRRCRWMKAYFTPSVIVR
jgi:hypothetical protein